MLARNVIHFEPRTLHLLSMHHGAASLCAIRNMQINRLALERSLAVIFFILRLNQTDDFK